MTDKKDYDASAVGRVAGDDAFTRADPYGVSIEPTYAHALSFLRRRYTRELDGVDVAVSGFPLDLATTGRPGARFGPRAIRAASVNLSWDRPQGWDFNPLDELNVIDYGDVVFDPGRPEEVVGRLEAHAAMFVEAGVRLLALGGDHFITYPILRALAAAHGPLALIHFDAHSDTWRDANGRVDHGTMFFHAKEQRLVDPARSVQVGIRTHNAEDHGFTILSAERVVHHSADEVAALIRDSVGDRLAYLTFDIDCLDPAYAPGTGTPVCGGLDTRTAIDILGRLGGIDLVGFDVTEVAPAYDIGEITALAGATIACQGLCLFAKAPRRHARA